MNKNGELVTKRLSFKFFGNFKKKEVFTEKRSERRRRNDGQEGVPMWVNQIQILTE